MPDKVCVECSTENPEKAKFCISCGFGFEMADNICSKCKATNPSNAKFCLECGNQIDDSHTNKDNQSELETDSKESEEIRLVKAEAKPEAEGNRQEGARQGYGLQDPQTPRLEEEAGFYPPRAPDR